jgi:hypothetical protein
MKEGWDGRERRRPESAGLRLLMDQMGAIDGKINAILERERAYSELNSRLAKAIDKHGEILYGNGQLGLIAKMHIADTELTSIRDSRKWVLRTVGGSLILQLVIATIAIFKAGIGNG